MNILLTSQTGSNGAVQLFTSGQFVGAGDEFTVDGNDDFVARYIANVGTFHRAEGQVVFQTPGRVTTIDFHASIDVNGCTFFGTAVTSHLS